MSSFVLGKVSLKYKKEKKKKQTNFSSSYSWLLVHQIRRARFTSIVVMSFNDILRKTNEAMTI